ncbi:hypothetical protein, partial [Staphylococcus aureus]|uniref:hypothetical protein n=1 Tax=Staphylococcus aureus TaxID=1280 RepID=UPI001E28F31C
TFSDVGIIVLVLVFAFDILTCNAVGEETGLTLIVAVGVGVALVSLSPFEVEALFSTGAPAMVNWLFPRALSA